MNVLFIANSLSLYGANNSMLDLIRQLRNNQINVVVLLFGYGEMQKECEKLNIKVYIIPYELNAHLEKTLKWNEKFFRLMKNNLYIAKAKEIIEDNNIDIIHSNASNIDFGAMLAMVYHLPHVWHIREILYDHYHLTYDFPLITKFLMNRADRIITISDYVSEKRRMSKKSITLYNGVDSEKYKIDSKTLFESEAIRILYCGEISHSKGIMDIIKSVKYLVYSGYTNVKLMIVGAESEYWIKVKNYINNNGLDSYITYYGHQADMRSFREQADIAIMSSRSEALGRVTIESMLGEVLVIGANSGATKELIKDGITGYLYEPGNYKQLADTILKVYEDLERSRKIVQDAKEYVLKTFNSEQYAKKMIKVYKELCPKVKQC